MKTKERREVEEDEEWAKSMTYDRRVFIHLGQKLLERDVLPRGKLGFR